MVTYQLQIGLDLGAFELRIDRAHLTGTRERVSGQQHNDNRHKKTTH